MGTYGTAVRTYEKNAGHQNGKHDQNLTAAIIMPGSNISPSNSGNVSPSSSATCTFVLIHWVVEKVMELDPVIAEIAAVQKLNREVASCCVAHMACKRGEEDTEDTRRHTKTLTMVPAR